MRYRAPVLTVTMFAATLSLSACGGGDTKAAATSPTSVASSSSTTSAPSTSTSTSAATAPAAPSAPAAPASSAATVTKTVPAAPSTKSVAPKTTTAGAPAQSGGCYASDGKSLYIEGVSCDFAKNIYAAANSGASTAYSPVTHLHYQFDCRTEGGGTHVNCGGGTIQNGGFVAWSL